jgi:hypothetical protein
MRMEAMEVQFHVISTATVDGGEWVSGQLTATAAVLLQKEIPLSVEKDVRWASEPV